MTVAAGPIGEAVDVVGDIVHREFAALVDVLLHALLFKLLKENYATALS